ncbi:RHS repeat-associated core domain-containing protein [Streptomyces sp. NBC_01373]|uniref:RHS repeat-associated core domain-containing protein n=1 Tax=Streptomyces sp. NBC_01373 TaxID=2903843 RepID=UPI00224CEE71|nr:RHS repeat-associated core domain-containing protein [Streptomyces sp. NBC_01373]MCX4698497.1 polymorphic toxin-type HINT domain-containing protein [Streptomyces sp. NBC_01373]
MTATARRRGRYVRARIALVVAAVMVATTVEATVTQAAEPSGSLPKVPASEKPVSGHGVKMLPRKGDGEPRVPEQAPKKAWPGAGSATVSVPAAAKSGARAGAKSAPVRVRAGDLPVSLTAAPQQDKAASTPLTGKAVVQVLDRRTAERAGVDGMVFSVRRQAGATGDRVGVSVDYSKFAQAYGGAYASRLKLVRLPACAATDPGSAKCSTPIPVAADNDPKAQTLTASSLALPATDSAPMVLAATAAASSDHGDYKATQLSASSTWNTNLNTGDFSWSYGMPVPDVPGSFTPQLGLAYSSGGIDGRTANSNNQASWTGDGFDLWPGFIERSYKPCADEGVKNSAGIKVGDLCWAYDNATLSFNGHSGELISTGTNSFRIKGDDGTKVDRIYGSDTNVRANGARDDEYWRVTTTDGTRYYFGYNRLPGWASGNAETNSAWTAPVFGNDSGEPCNAAAFADSWCQQGWRWNLDYAVDARGNSIAYYYDKETNHYGRNLKPEDETPYVRGGSLNHIDYGLRNTTNYSAKALGRVDFTSAERCLPETGVTCAAATIDDKSFYWYDTPWDLNCKSGTDCTSSPSPSFWTRKRLTGVTASTLKADGTYAPVDTWKMDHRWGMSDIAYQLLLTSVEHTGRAVTPEITLPKVTFGYDQRSNRLDIAGDDTAPFIKERLSTIADESGGQTDVTYSTAVCDASNPPTPETNSTRCFPVFFTREGDENPTRQWFNKYVVDAVTQTDRTKSSPDMVTRYSYLDGAAWHYDDDDGLTKEKYKTWSAWRGYAHVRVLTGGQDPVGMKAQTDHYFLRGMDGDRAGPSGGTKSVTVSDDNGGTITDHASAAGFEYRTASYSGPGGKILEKSVNTPWHRQTASRVRSWGSTTANLTGTAATRTWTSLDDGAGTKWRTTYKTNTFENTVGRVVQTDDFGDETTSQDNQCTRTTYVDNTTDWILDAPSRAETVAVKCADTPDRTKAVISDVRTAYDGQAYGTAPTKGDATRTATLTKHDGTTASYLESESTYDTYGRQLTDKDISATVTATETTAPARTARTDGRTTTTAYTPATGFPKTSTVTTPPATAGTAATAQVTTTTYDSLRGLPVTVLDTNNKRTDTTYDALGRNQKIWLPNRSQANDDTPNYQFTYTMDGSGPVAVGTRTLKNDGTQQTTYQLLDGFLRERQTQAPGPSGGRLVADTFYDERGLVAKQFAPYYNDEAAPSPGLLQLDNALSVETQTWNTFDGLGRVTMSQQIAGNGDHSTVLSTTRTDYGGDRVSVTPPKGATATTSVTDARGNVTDLLQYQAATPTGAYDQTHYDYTPTGKLSKLTDPSGNSWSYTYDQRGNQTLATDPDKGDTKSVYDDRSQLVSTTDHRGRKVTHLYDGLGRELETREGEATGPLLTQQVWDPTGFEGQLATSTRYVGGASGLAYKTTYSMYDNLYRPQRTAVAIPSVTGEEALAGTYLSSTVYNLDGTVQSKSYPAAGSLASEILTPTYDEIQRPKTLGAGGGVTYVTDTTYSYTGKPLQFTYQSAGAKKTQVTNSYQWGTQRLSNSRLDREDVAGTDRSATYAYDEAGNVTSISDVSRSGTDTQCFQYDHLTRLKEAWTQGSTSCSATPSASVLGGPAAYWHSYTYDKSGNRTGETRHDTAGDTAKDVKRTYRYPAAGGARPHAVTSIDTTGPTGTATDSFTYTASGDTETRTIGGTKQTLEWDAEGHLSKVTEPAGSGTKTTSYVYDAEGQRLLRRTDAETTVYLGATELTLTKGATADKATRYYDLGGGNQAIRTDDNKLAFLIGDHHGTSEIAVNATDLTMQQRRSTPFGGTRGSPPGSWPGEKGFVGGTQDTTTGLTHLGAREYDPATGRFLSVDPLLNTDDPQSLNGYAYSNNNPVTLSDPAGTEIGSRPNSCQYSLDNCSKEVQESVGYNPVTKRATASQQTVNVGKARAIKQTPVIQVVKKVGWELFKDFIGWNDFKGCMGGSVSSCATLIIGAIPWTAMFKKGAQLIKGAWKIAKAVKKWRKEQKWADDILESAASCEVKHSFLPGTKVLLADGTTKDIEDVKTGDVVLVTDPETGRTVERKAVRTITTEDDKDFTVLTVATRTGPSTITATDTHPFWVPDLRKWVDAGDLEPGQHLRTSAGTYVQISAVAHYTKRQRTHDLTIDEIHTYYVLVGDSPVLVHNDNCGVSRGSGAGSEDPSSLPDLYDPDTGGYNAPRGRGEPLEETGQSRRAAEEVAEEAGTRATTVARSPGAAQKMIDGAVPPGAHGPAEAAVAGSIVVAKGVQMFRRWWNGRGK